MINAQSRKQAITINSPPEAVSKGFFTAIISMIVPEKFSNNKDIWTWNSWLLDRTTNFSFISVDNNIQIKKIYHNNV